ncbi:hypothetical protein D3C74_466550 [compost metagenome]
MAWVVFSGLCCSTTLYILIHEGPRLGACLLGRVPGETVPLPWHDLDIDHFHARILQLIGECNAVRIRDRRIRITMADEKRRIVR